MPINQPLDRMATTFARDASASALPLTRFRWWIVAVLFLLNFVNNIDRQVFALVGPTVQHDLRLGELEFARLVEVFQFVFAIGCLAAGPIVDRVGVRKMALGAIAWFSMAQLGHIFARSMLGLVVARVGLAIGEAPIYPATLKAIGEWAPRSERSVMAGAVHFGVMLGPCIAPVFIPWLTAVWGWQAGFVVTGLLGFLVLIPFWLVYSTPENTLRASEAEKNAIFESRVRTVPTIRTPWLGLLRHRQVWVYIVIQSFVNPAWWFLVYWLPKFLGEVFGIKGSHLTPYLTTVYAVAAVGAIGGGSISGLLLRRGWPLHRARISTMLLCGLLMPVIIVAAHTRSAWAAIAVISLAAVIHQTWTATGAAILADLVPPRAIASTVGLGTFIGSIAGVVGAEVTGRILSVWPAFYLPMFIYAGFAYLGATAMIQILSPRMQPAEDL
jgi:ACS family hexuronate transporter-like MFS transporter